MERLFRENVPRPWEDYVFYNYQCDGCYNELRGPRYRCQNCDDLDLCAACFEAKVHSELEHHFIRIQYRPLYAPPPDGSDLPLLERAQRATNATELATYYPWTFTAKQNLSLVATARELAEQQLEELLSMDQMGKDVDDVGDDRIKGLQWCLEQASDDQLVRVSELAQPQQLLDDEHNHLWFEKEKVRAEYSQQLWKIYERLKVLVERYQSTTMPGVDDMQLPTGASNMLAFMETRNPEIVARVSFLNLRMALHTHGFSSSVNHKIIIAAAAKFMDRFRNDILDSDDVGISEGNNVETPCLREHFAELMIISQGMQQPMPPQSALGKEIHPYEIIQPEGSRVRRLFFENVHRFQEIGNQDPKYYASCHTISTDHTKHAPCYSSDPTLDSDLVQSITLAQCGKFREAIAHLQSIAANYPHNPSVTFCIMRIYEAQGDLRSAIVCGQDFLRSAVPEQLSAEGCPKEQLVRLSLKYLQLYSEGIWKEALELAASTLEFYLAGSRWFETEGYTPSIVWLELYYHRIIHLARKDMSISTCTEYTATALRRLHAIRQHLQFLGNGFLAWEVGIVELEIQETMSILQRDEAVDAEFMLPMWEAHPNIAAEIIRDFLDKTHWQSGSEYQQALVQGYAWISLAFSTRRLCTRPTMDDKGMTFSMQAYQGQRDTAAELFKKYDCYLGLLEVDLFDATAPGEFHETSLAKVYSQFQEINYLSGMRRVKGMTVEFADMLFWEPPKLPQSELMELAEKAGDMYATWLHKLRMVEGWIFTPAIIEECENFLGGGKEKAKFQSEILNAIATWNLARAFRVNGNARESASNALAHYRSMASTEVQEYIVPAVKSWLQCLGDLIHSIKPPIADTVLFARLQHCWCQKIVAQVTIRYQTDETFSCGELVWILDIILCLPEFSKKLISTAETSFMAMEARLPTYDETAADIPGKQKILGLMAAHLLLATAIVDAFPGFALPVVLKKPLHALGMVSTYCGNPELAIYSFDQAVQSLHPSEDDFKHRLNFLIGQQIIQRVVFDFPHFGKMLPKARELLSAAQTWFLKGTFRNDSYTAGVEASVALTASYLYEMAHISRHAQDAGTEDCELSKRIVELYQQGYDAAMVATAMCFILRKEFEGLSALRTLVNKRMLYHRNALQDIYQLHLALCIVARSYAANMIDLWNIIQAWKATSLADIIGAGYRVPAYLQELISHDCDAQAMLEREKELAHAIEVSPPHERLIARARLLNHQEGMKDNRTLRPLIGHRCSAGATFADLDWINEVAASMAEAELVPPEPGDETVTGLMIFLDWIKCGDQLVLVSYKPTGMQLAFTTLHIQYSAVQAWYDRYLGLEYTTLEGKGRRKRLESSQPLRELTPLVEPLTRLSAWDNILVFCPTGILTSIPLHAIPFADDSDEPILTRNPIVYCASNTVLRECVSRAHDQQDRPSTSTTPEAAQPDHNNKFPLKAAIFGRYGPSDTVEQLQVHNAVTDLAKQLGPASCTVATESQLTKAAFVSGVVGKKLIHYHGHASLEPDDRISRALMLEPDSQSGEVCDGRLSIPDIFNLSLVEAPHVTILACASGEQDVEYNDDPLGILSAFLCAGASSVIGTLWPTQSSDAREFTKAFYSYSFPLPAGNTDTAEPEQSVDHPTIPAGGAGDYVNLAHALQDAVLYLRELNDEPYHWAQFVLHGSWFCKAGN